ncbi:MAG: ABC transporter permease [Leptolyngbyaceae cyanobacterium SL_5_14]|nr:ABC transporter permease [Leptolyngbyaceae cyanobacterium SL_5_14]
MNSSIQAVSIDELLQRVGAQPEGNIWLTAIVACQNFDNAISELSAMLDIFLECEIGVISASNGVFDLTDKISYATQSYLLLRDFESWFREDWQKFDSLRSRLDQEKRGGILILSLEAAKAMLSHAPNFASWLGPRIFRLILGVELLTTEERQMRLLALRKWSGKSDSEVIALAKVQKLPTDPEYGEWLILLEREDLLER